MGVFTFVQREWTFKRTSGQLLDTDTIDPDDPEGYAGLVLRIRDVRLRSPPNPSHSPNSGPHSID